MRHRLNVKRRLGRERDRKKEDMLFNTRSLLQITEKKSITAEA